MEKTVSKAALAVSLGVSRSSLYYVPKQPKKDELLREAIIRVLAEHPAYGCRRIALTLGTGKNRVHRIMKKYGIVPKLRRKRRQSGTRTAGSGVPNRLKHLTLTRPNQAWSGDFTEFWFHGTRIYFATVLDCYTRELVGWQVGTHHTTQLILDVLVGAKTNQDTVPALFHSDQGSEYTAHAVMLWLANHYVVPSHSPKGKPWNNGKQESFFSTFKFEFGKPSRHQTIPALIEAIGRYIHYYNTRRIHSALKLPPRTFYEKWESEGV